MTKDIGSLIGFTLIVQMGAGALLLHVLAGYLATFQPAPSWENRWNITILGLLVTGLVISFFHLSYPQHAVFALRNLGQSWLSREILSLALLIGVTGVLTGLKFLGLGQPRLLAIAGGLAALLALLLVLSMTMIYKVETIPNWNRGYTAISFFGSMLVLGGILLYSYLRFGVAGWKGKDLMGFILQLVILTSLLMELLAVILWAPPARHPVLQVLRITCLALAFTAWLVLFRYPKILPWHGYIALWVLATGLTLFQEIAGRYLFYTGYERVGV